MAGLELEGRGVYRTLAVVRALNNHNGATLTELAKDTGISRPALYRILAALLASGHVVRRRGDGRYFLSELILELSAGYKRNYWLAEVGRSAVDDLQAQIRWPTDFAVFDDNRMQIVHTTRDQSPFVIDTGRVGDRLMVHRTALGLAFLAFCEPARQHDFLQASMALDSEANATLPSIRARIRTARARGYATRFRTETAPETNTLKTGAVAVPIFVRDAPIGSIGFSFIASALSLEEAVRLHLNQLKAAARKIATAIVNSQRQPTPSVAYKGRDLVSAGKTKMTSVVRRGQKTR